MMVKAYLEVVEVARLEKATTNLEIVCSSGSCFIWDAVSLKLWLLGWRILTLAPVLSLFSI